MNPIFDESGHSVPEAPSPQASASRRSQRRSRKVRRRRRTVIFFIVVIAFIGALVFAFQAIRPMLDFDTAKDFPGPGKDSVVYTLKQGANARTVAKDLVDQGVVASENAFINAVSDQNGADKLLPGKYLLKKEMPAKEAASTILAASNQQVHYAPIAQNLRQNEVFEQLSESTGIPVTEFATLAKQPTAFGLPANAPSLEGYLAPGEYRFDVGATAKEILQKLIQTTFDELTKAGVTDAAKQYRTLTIASIIEAEGSQKYFPQISGAIENRLNKSNAETGGRLESDATLAYGLNVKTYNLTDAQKQDSSNPYNTFAKTGLPVGPIGSPVLSAIQAAAHPEANDYYFWVTVNLDTGETLFAKTYAEHQENVKKYQAWCTANTGRCK